MVKMIVDLAFDDEFVPQIESGNKTITFRRTQHGTDGDAFKCGDKYYVITRSYHVELPDFIVDNYKRDGFEHISDAYYWFARHYNGIDVYGIQAMHGYAHEFIPMDKIDMSILVSILQDKGWYVSPIQHDENYTMLRNHGSYVIVPKYNSSAYADEVSEVIKFCAAMLGYSCASLVWYCLR